MKRERSTRAFTSIAQNLREMARLLQVPRVLSVAQLKLALGIIADLMIRPPGPRIAAILLRLAGVRLKSKLDGNSLELDVTQKELAHISNLSRATVGNQLDQMQADGLIRRNYGHLTHLDPSALRRLVAEGENEH